MVRNSPRWSTRFGRWVGSYGVRRLSTTLTQASTPVTVRGIHEWVAGRSAPRLETAVAIERISRGAVRCADIAAHLEKVRG